MKGRVWFTVVKDQDQPGLFFYVFFFPANPFKDFHLGHDLLIVTKNKHRSIKLISLFSSNKWILLHLVLWTV